MGLILMMMLLATPYFAQAQTITDPPSQIAPVEWQLLEPIAGVRKFRTTFSTAAPTLTQENNSVPLFLFLPQDQSGPIPCVLILHYWGASDHRVEFNTATDLARRGIAAAVISLPYHIERKGPEFRSGEQAITPDPDRLIVTMTQSILDVRRALDVLSQRADISHDEFGITGTSLGAIVAALASGIENRIAHAAFVVGGVDLAHILWHSSRVVKERDQLRSAGWTETRLREKLAPIEAATYLAQRKPKSAYVVEAKYDTVIPPSATQKLLELLPGAHVLSLETGHYGGFFVQKQVQRSVADYFQKSFAGQAFAPPKSINAPTVRLGVSFDIEDSFEISAGIDLIRPKRTNDIFMTLLISPEDVRLYLGKPLDRGLSIGVFVTSDRPIFGLVWSVVL